VFTRVLPAAPIVAHIESRVKPFFRPAEKYFSAPGRVGEREYAVWLAEGGPEALNAELVRAGVGVRGLARRHTALEDTDMELAGESRADAETVGSAMQELPADLEGGPE
jgi:hypothetical protein